MSILTRDAVVCAQRLNLYYSRRLGWPLPPAFRDVQSSEFAYFIARLQRDSRGLYIDGIMGPKTYAYMVGKTWTPPADDHLIVAGETVKVDFPVVTFENPEGLSFYGQDGWAPRADPSGAKIDLLVMHWDECVSSHHCFHTLLMRRLSAHLLIDGDGTVYQTLDLAEARAWHARQVNDRSVGIEIQNPVRPDPSLPTRPTRPLITEVTPHSGETWSHLDFTPRQKARATALAQVLCRVLRVPEALPQDASGVLMGLMPNDFKGVCGHYHVTTDKVDPGTSLWPALQQSWAPARVADTAAPSEHESTAAS